MASIIKDWHRQYEEALPHADPNSKDWFLVQNDPIYVISLTIIYVLIVWLGPKLMQNRPAFDYKWFMVVYNLGLVGLSLYMTIEIYLSTKDAGYGWMCAPYNHETRKNPKELRVAHVMWWYFFSKAIELLDTVLMILRKRNRQITFLHVYHHASMLNIWWWVMMFIPGGLAYFGSWLNCIVHVFMYAYYGLSAIPSMRNKLWWKAYLTQFQLIQFCFTLSHTLYSMFSGCDFPMWGKQLLGWYMISMLILFSNFYIKSYRSSRAKSRSTQSGDTKSGDQTKVGQNGVSSHNGTAHPDHITNGSATSKKRV